jgi:hypothetical protein
VTGTVLTEIGLEERFGLKQPIRLAHDWSLGKNPIETISGCCRLAATQPGFRAYVVFLAGALSVGVFFSRFTAVTSIPIGTHLSRSALSEIV